MNVWPLRAVHALMENLYRTRRGEKKIRLGCTLMDRVHTQACADMCIAKQNETERERETHRKYTYRATL